MTMTENPAKIRHSNSTSLRDTVYEQIRDQIIKFRFYPGQRINEVTLSNALSVSRTPVREALQRLELEGFLSFSKNHGFTFKGMDTKDIFSLFEARSIIEKGAIEIGCERASDEEIAAIAHFHETHMEKGKARTPDSILAYDEELHMMIARLAHNPEIERHLSLINRRIRFVRRIKITRGELNYDLHTSHSGIIEAIAKRDKLAAGTLMSQHIQMSMTDAHDVMKQALIEIYNV